MKELLSVLFVGAALAPAQSQSPITRDGAYWVRTIQGGIDASSSGRLRVETTGNVSLRGSAGEQTTYTLTVRVKAGNAREAEALMDRVNVKTGTEGGWASIKVTPPRRDSSGLELTVTGPRALRQVRAETLGGNVQGSGGDIEVGNVSGALRCLSGGGAIRVDSAGAAVWLETAGGEISVHQAGGPVQASTGGGNIRVERAASTVVARTSGGLIQVQQADGPVTAESSGGAIQVNSANGVRCESAGGAIRLRNVAGAVHAFANSGSIMAELGAGAGDSGHAMANSVLSTNAGDITVLIPSNLALTIQAVNETGGSGRINSDFPQVRPQPGGMRGMGPLMAEGALNGGGPLLRVNVVAGTIYLRRAK
jgi:hypothetical protein